MWMRFKFLVDGGDTRDIAVNMDLIKMMTPNGDRTILMDDQGETTVVESPYEEVWSQIMSIGEPVAVRYGFDGNGWRYADDGNGSDWFTRAMEYPDAEPLFDRSGTND